MKKTIIMSLLAGLLSITNNTHAKDFALFDNTKPKVSFFDANKKNEVGQRITTSEQIKNAMVGDVLTLNIEGKGYRIVIKKRTQHNTDIVNLIGYIQGTQHRTILTRGASGSVGTIETEQGTYDITSNQAGEWLISPNDKKSIKKHPIKDQIIRPPVDNDTSAPRLLEMQSIGNINSTDKAIIEIMVFWDQAFETRVGGASRALTVLHNRIAATNQAFADSDIYIDLKLVHSGKIAHSDNISNLDTLSTMQKDEGAFAGVAALRTTYGADLVGFIREDNDSYKNGGIAYTLGENGRMRNTYKSLAFFIVLDHENDSFYSNITFMHEIGHNLGSFHDRNHADTSDGPPIFPYSFGHDDCSVGNDCGTFGTIMSYDTPHITKFSTPNKICGIQGKPCGIASNQPNPADNTTGFNNIRFDVANFYTRAINIDNQTREIAENTGINVKVGSVITASGTPDTYEIIAGNTTLFKIDNTGQITTKSNLNFEDVTQQYLLTVKVTKANTAPKSATITINVTDVEEAPTIAGGSSREINVVEGNTTITTLNAIDEDIGQTPTLSLTNSNLFTLTDSVLSFKTAQTFDNIIPANNRKSITITANSNGQSFSQVITVITIQLIDRDNDGISDQWERSKFGNLTTTDGTGDYDGDGVNDKDEFIANTNPKIDDVKPTFTPISEIILNATGKKTGFSRSAFGVVSVNDTKDGNLIPLTPNIQAVDGKNASVSGGLLILTSGRHSLTWKATDNTGNFATITQTVNVRPTANFAIQQFTSEGQTATVHVFLSGVAPSYPVLIPFSVSGTVDTDDYSITSPMIKITSGQEGSVPITIKSNADVTEESMTLTMGELTNAVKGNQATHNITIVTSNIAPKIESFTVIQNGIKGTSIQRINQSATITAEVFDANNDALTYEWSLSNNSTNTTSVTFDPMVLDLDKSYRLTLTVTDDKSAFVKRDIQIKIIAPITHGNSTDTDGDGILDKNEAGDNDGNGIPDYREIPHQPNELVTQGDKQMMVSVGNRLLVGTMADDTAKLTTNDINNYRTRNGDTSFHADTYTSRHIYDYKIEGLAKAGEVVSVVIETAPMLANTRLRKYNLNTNSWGNFQTDENNKYYSTTVTTGTSCPAADSNTWGTKNILRNGANCLLVMIEDGGNNDADAQKNGSIDDPLSLSTPIATPPSSGGGGGGGCVYNPSAPARFDIVFILLTVLSIYYLARRRRRVFTG